MNLEFNFTSTLDIAGVLQGLILGTLLIYLFKKKDKSILYLGVFLVLYALQRIPDILTELNAFEKNPELFLLPLISLWVIYPLFFIYTQQIALLKDEKIKYWLLYPGVLFYIFQIYIYFLPYEAKLEISSEPYFKLGYFLGILFGWFVSIWNLKLIENHKIEVNNQFSMAQFKELRWVRTFLIVSVTGSMLYIVQYYLIDKNLYSRIFFLSFDLLIIYWVSYHGVEQLNVHSLLSEKNMFETLSEPAALKNDTVISSDKYKAERMAQIENYMSNSEIYTKPDLTIIDIAGQLTMHPKLISTTINSVRGQNFNTYINQYRIDKAITLLKSNASLNLSIEGIGNEVGFNSKSSFYTAFKKVTGTTPIDYKKKELA